MASPKAACSVGEVDELRVVISCEHAAWRVPVGLDSLGLDERVLRSHASWDPGAHEVAARLADAKQVELHEGRWSRLVADLNRDAESAEAVPAIAFGVEVPANQDLGVEARRARIDAFHAPYWQKVDADVAEGVARGRVLHLSIHSFDPDYGDEARPWDFGVLHDPDATFEAPVAQALQVALSAGDDRTYLAAPNVPYDGRSDFLVTSFRRRFAPERYAGILLEVSQRHLSDLESVGLHVVRAVEAVVQTLKEGKPQ